MKRHGAQIGCFAAAVALLAFGCATPQPRQVLVGPGASLSRFEVEELLRLEPIPVADNIQVRLLRKTDRASVHLVQIRHAESPHVHRTHDLTAYMVRGFGEMVIGWEKREVREGDVIHVPAGVRHYFVNRSPAPAAAVAVFSPALEGSDTEPVE